MSASLRIAEGSVLRSIMNGSTEIAEVPSNDSMNVSNE